MSSWCDDLGFKGETMVTTGRPSEFGILWLYRGALYNIDPSSAATPLAVEEGNSRIPGL